MLDEIRALASEQDALILAHNYQVPEVQDMAHHVGDSLELARIASKSTVSTIVLCGVLFMAETAKILAYEKRVLIPDQKAGCSLAASITADQLREWKAEHPDAVVVMYVNTDAAVKAESDYCCTSANAVEVVESIPKDREILFGPDMFLGAHVERVTGRKMHLWMGECHVHAAIQPDDISRTLEQHPAAEFLIHPECGCSSQALYLSSVEQLPAGRTFIVGTGGMLDRAERSEANEFVVATETGMLHRLRKENPSARFRAANPEAVCGYMKMITPHKLLECLQTGHYEVDVPQAVAEKAHHAIRRMIGPA